ncbi:hypothetical protein BDA96_03G270000 [Sorghum bicolor]|uniref:Uncharacterized protein n=2 Tax=Sorghum bicolor TaxID=4558 RepID=A0A921RGF5_SORBI|nr:uncharacterized protein LOC8060147 [Sorghum bicolor]EES01227.1 hypothetical protein SORBI_3003G249400 [Sorghum bicolor]KAG0538822.1 hypothetical protein BDA96_03G270000 [Sorghum bicolor]|eukprot:XP_002456107.1 uncharacterized protein LOC8060147 [Sorghum bicolor]
MACSFSPSSSATRLQAVDAAAAAAVGVKNGRVPLNLKASVAPAQRSLGLGCCRATARQEGATQEPNVAVSSARAQLDLLEQLTSPTPDGIAGLENGVPTESRQRATIRQQLSALANGKVVDEFTLPLGRKLKEGLKSLNKLTVSQRRNIKRQALLTQVSGRNDSVFFATVGAFVLVPPFAILAIAVITGYVQLFP